LLAPRSRCSEREREVWNGREGTGRHCKPKGSEAETGGREV
jgi:hypothetical protein